MKYERSAGILLHPTSLPGPDGIGDLIVRLVPPEGFPDLRRLFQIALTLPIANVSAERSF